MTGIILLRVEREGRFVRFPAIELIPYTAIALVTPVIVLQAGLRTISYVLLPVWF